MRRALTTLALLLLTAASALADGAPYAGRAVIDIIEEFRSAGVPFAYSTNLVAPGLVVIEEPEPGTPLETVRQILRPHGLTVEERAGVYLVMRFDTKGLEFGSILLVITIGDSGEAMPQAAVTVRPGLDDSTRIKPGIYEYAHVAPGRYAFSIEAAGFEPVRKIVDVWPGEARVVSIGMDAARFRACPTSARILCASCSGCRVRRRAAHPPGRTFAVGRSGKSVSC